MAFDTNVAPPTQAALEIRPPQVQSPLEAAAQFQQLRAGQQQSQAAAMENQQRALDLQDQQVARQAYMESGGDMGKFQKLLMQGGASPKMVTQIQQQILATKKTLAETDKATLENNQTRHDQARGELTSFEAAPDQQQKAAQYPQVMQNLHRRGLLNDQEYSEWMQQNPAYPGSDAMKMGINHLATGSQLSKEEIERRNAASSETSAAARKSTADTAATRLTLERPGIEANNVTRGLQVGAQTLAGVNDQAGYDAWRQANPESAKRLSPMFSPVMKDAGVKMGLTADQQITTAQTAAHDTAMETNAKRLANIAAGRLGVAQKHANIAQSIYDQTYGEGANPALVGVEPKLRTQAASAAQKAADEYTKGMESLRNVQSFIDLARSGNKAAGSNLPIMGAESIQALNGIRRINRTEIEQYQGAGSLLDRIQGRIGKIASGQPIPADVMKDIEDLHKTIAGNAATTYNSRLDSVNQNYHASFKPVAGRQQQPAAPAAARGGYQLNHLYNGMEYLGGDPNSAGSWKQH